MEIIQTAAGFRQRLPRSCQAYRLFNGFYEGIPGLVIDRYADTLVILDHGLADDMTPLFHEVSAWALTSIGGIQAILLKQRQHPDGDQRRGRLIAGDHLPDRIEEMGVFYQVDLRLNQDTSFYLDSRNLRAWLLKNALGRRILNTFAYTGSLGVAAGAGSAHLVVQTDLNSNFLEIAKKSWALNELQADRQKLIAGDFFKVTGRMRHEDVLFDGVIIDPPFFSTTQAGRVDLLQNTVRLINKVRPLIAHQGWLVVINNALFLSGQSWMNQLQMLCESPYLTLDQTIPVPEDITGYPDTTRIDPPVDSAPFNHPTKMAVLKVFRKDERV